MLDTKLFDDGLLFDDELGLAPEDIAENDVKDSEGATGAATVAKTAFEADEAEFTPKSAEQHRSTAAPVVPKKPPAYADPEKPAEERIRLLLDGMNARRKVLLEIMRFCEEKKSVEAVNEHIDGLQKNNLSVYSGAVLGDLLLKAGAIVRVDEEGLPVTEDDIEPVEVIDEDGNAYLEIPEPRQTFWVATPAGIEAAHESDPTRAIAAFFEAEAPYKGIYRQVLTMCASENGTTSKAVADAIEDDPLLTKPRRFGAYFLEHLDDLDAIRWVGHWELTEAGRAALANLTAEFDAAASGSDDAANAATAIAN